MIILKTEWPPQVVAALIAGIVSIIVAIWTYFSGRLNHKEILQNQRQIEAIKSDLTLENEKLKSELAERRSENDARRVYEFEARKRLYHEYEPLLFQLMEAADNALHRIQSLARTARHGNLEENGWLSVFNYYSKSTIYKLFVPLALYQIMQRKLTLVDVSVDKSIDLYYRLTKQIYISYTDDFEFARGNPSIEYDPNNTNWRNMRVENQPKYWRQGIPMGLLDKTIEFLIDNDRVISYGEFERKIVSEHEQHPDVNLAKDVFHLFHPERRPVLWRLLIMQAIVFQALLELRKVEIGKIDEELVKEKLFSIDLAFMESFNWQNNPHLDQRKIVEPFEVATEYLSKRF